MRNRTRLAGLAATAVVALVLAPGCGAVARRAAARRDATAPPVTAVAATTATSPTSVAPVGPPSTAGAAPSSSTTSVVVAPSIDVAGSAPAGCGSPRPAGQGVTGHTIVVGGRTRSYLVSVPPGYDGTQATPVVYTFHGLGSNDRQQLAYSGFGALGDQDGFIVVAPQAEGHPAAWDLVAPLSDPASDGSFVLALTRSVDAAYCTDQRREFATGISNGSGVVFALACSGRFEFAAYGGVAGAFANPRCAPGPVPIIYFQGSADPLVPIDGGTTLGHVPVKPAAQTMAAWAAHDGCRSGPDTTSVASDVSLQRWTGCTPPAEVDYYVIAGGGHTWPGASAVGTRLLGPTTHSISATALMWSFFQAHPKG